MLQILILPVTANFTLLPMDEEEAAEREMRGRGIHASRETLAADSTWLSKTDTVLTARIVIFSAPPRQNRKNNNATSVVVVIVAMMVIVMVMVPPPPTMMVMVMMLGESCPTVGVRIGPCRIIALQQGQRIRDRIEQVSICCSGL